MERELGARVQEAMSHVVVELDPTRPVFADHLDAVTVLYPVFYALDDEWLDALVAAARSVGDDEMYVYRIEVPEGEDEFVRIPFVDLGGYLDAVPLQNACISPSGQWVLVANEMGYAVVGSTAKFMNAFEVVAPTPLSAQVDAFRAYAADLRIEDPDRLRELLETLDRPISGGAS